ncbi:protein NLRC3-like [Acanthochromis polyacanthus]|uniref:protein NLRC3-like n=1 Tax=Acanthochromis polyacanthus TaxID=80966 RepID=UPI0022348141|nr:protein NLRC3-like [Acanthochromis polyacanthus]
MTSEDLKNILDDLKDDELHKFQWFLQQPNNVQGLPAIRKRKLQTTTCNTVDVMVETYGLQRAVEVTRVVLEKISRNDLLERFSASSSGPEGYNRGEEYFRKTFSEEEQASSIISHMKKSRSLHIMCHIPVFCWITATVLEELLRSREGGDLPRTLTEMYTEFLRFQIDRTKEKYGPEKRIQFIKSLAKLAFEQLQKVNLIFYEKDLRESGIDVSEASVYSGVFTEIFKAERRRKQEDKVFSFIHLSVQEFLAALHVHLTFINSGIILLEEEQTTFCWSKLFREKVDPTALYQRAVDEALQSPNGHLDLFLRFLLGLSLPTNQNLLRGLLTQTGSSSQTNQKTVEYIKKKISENVSAERSINLFHCLSELKDVSLVEEIQQSLRSGRLSTDKLSPAQWSALGFILLSSEEHLDVFDLKKYSASEEVLLRLLPVVKASKKVV